jgi:serine/threonine-protein kinase
MIGRQLGPFTIQSLLGAGGMGEVYRAHDSRLDRDVAIKVLPATLLIDPERRARFDREARLLASLNHPHIGAIYGVEDVGDTRALVLELVQGPTLAERIESGPLPLKESLRIASQIADALDAAHQNGVVHRDLKPANIKIRTDGAVKVLDFGLGKIAADDLIPSSTKAATAAMATREGVVMGTAAYMSPEQARGAPVDKRSDIWAFGCILYEMLTGRTAFDRPTWSDTIAIILEREPDWQAVPPTTPVSIQRLVRRCLEKDVTRRLRDIGDARSELDDMMSSRTDGEPAMTSTETMIVRRRPFLLAAIAVASALAAGTAVWMLKPVPPAAASPIARLTVSFADGDTLPDFSQPGLAISPDGRTLAYMARRGERAQLFVRSIDKIDATLLAGTDGGRDPFFSPDGRWLAFFAEGKLKKVLTTGGGLETLCDAASGLGGSWSTDDTIYFAPFNTSGIWKVSASGGMSTEFSHMDRKRGEVSHRWPQVLSDGKTVLFTVWTGPGWDEKHLEIQVGSTDHRRLVPGASTGRYVRSGHLVYSKAEALVAVPFDLSTLKVTGNPVTLVDRAYEAEAEGAYFAVSDSGTLAYIPGNVAVFERRLVWVRRDGIVEPIPASPNAYTDPALSPDGRSAAVSIQGATQTLWIYDFARSTMTTLPSAGSSQAPVWTRDGRRVIYRGTRNGYRNLYWRSADGAGEEERLTNTNTLQTPASISHDATLLFVEVSPETGADVWTLGLPPRTRASQVLINTRFSEGSAVLSPDGRWVAYDSNESGRPEIYVRPFPGPGGKLAISTGGGTSPRWSHDGRELFYRSEDRMMAVDVQTNGPSPTARSPRLLFNGHYQVTDTGIGGYDVATDGRFLMVQPSPLAKPVTQIAVVTGWFEDLKARMRAAVP